MTFDEIIYELAKMKAAMLPFDPDAQRRRQALEEAITIVADSRDYDSDLEWMVTPLTRKEQASIDACDPYRPTEVIYDLDLKMYVVGED